MQGYKVIFNNNKSIIIINATLNEIEDFYKDRIKSIQIIKDNIIYFNNKNINTIDSVVDLAVNVFGVKRSFILEPTRFQKAVKIRHAIYYICYHTLDFSYQEIANFFKKDHTTIIHGVRNVNTNYLSKLTETYNLYQNTQENQ